MGIKIDKAKCTACGDCVNICPGDLILLDPETNKARIREQRDCWDCMSCIKACPEGAIQTKLPYQLANYGASLIPKISPEEIYWTATTLKGEKEEFIIKRKS